jgi:hypothetical protein
MYNWEVKIHLRGSQSLVFSFIFNIKHPMVGVPNFDYPTIVKKGLYPNSCGLPWKIGAISTKVTRKIDVFFSDVKVH